MSLVESIANVAVGFAVAMLTQIVVFPMFGLRVEFRENLAIGGIFTLVSIARTYAMRRLFEAIWVRSPPRVPPGDGPAASRHGPFNSAAGLGGGE